MKTGVILVQKWNIEEADLETVGAFHEKIKATLPANIKAVVIPHNWELKQIDDKVIYIGMNHETHTDDGNAFVDAVKDALGEEYTVLSNACKAEVINEKY